VQELFGRSGSPWRSLLYGKTTGDIADLRIWTLWRSLTNTVFVGIFKTKWYGQTWAYGSLTNGFNGNQYWYRGIGRGFWLSGYTKRWWMYFFGPVAPLKRDWIVRFLSDFSLVEGWNIWTTAISLPRPMVLHYLQDLGQDSFLWFFPIQCRNRGMAPGGFKNSWGGRDPLKGKTPPCLSW